MPDDNYFDETSDRTIIIERDDLRLHGVPAIEEDRTPVLVRMDGSDIGQVTTLEGSDIARGRHVKSAIQLPYEGVSRQHARLTWREGGYWIDDLDSANGTFVKAVAAFRADSTGGRRASSRSDPGRLPVLDRRYE